jgi:hypothetical protein
MCACTHTHTHTHTHTQSSLKGRNEWRGLGTVEQWHHQSLCSNSVISCTYSLCKLDGWVCRFYQRVTIYTGHYIYILMYVLCVYVCVWAHASTCVVQDKNVNKEQTNKGDYITNQNYQEIPLDWRDQYKYSVTLITCPQLWKWNHVH